MIDILFGCCVASMLGGTSLMSVPRGASAHSMVFSSPFSSVVKCSVDAKCGSSCCQVGLFYLAALRVVLVNPVVGDGHQEERALL